MTVKHSYCSHKEICPVDLRRCWLKADSFDKSVIGYLTSVRTNCCWMCLILNVLGAAFCFSEQQTSFELKSTYVKKSHCYCSSCCCLCFFACFRFDEQSQKDDDDYGWNGSFIFELTGNWNDTVWILNDNSYVLLWWWHCTNHSNCKV